MATEANAVAVVDGVAYLATPHALLWVASTLLGNSVADGGADLLDPRGREGRGDVEGGVNVTLKASEGVGTGETGRAAVEGLPFYLKGVSELSHTYGEAVASLFVGTEMLDLAGQSGVVLVKDGPVYTAGQL